MLDLVFSSPTKGTSKTSLLLVKTEWRYTFYFIRNKHPKDYNALHWMTEIAWWRWREVVKWNASLMSDNWCLLCHVHGTVQSPPRGLDATIFELIPELAVSWNHMGYIMFQSHSMINLNCSSPPSAVLFNSITCDDDVTWDPHLEPPVSK